MVAPRVRRWLPLARSLAVTFAVVWLTFAGLELIASELLRMEEAVKPLIQIGGVVFLFCAGAVVTRWIVRDELDRRIGPVVRGESK